MLFQQGTCSNGDEDYSGHCPPSYSQCVDNYCSCSEGRNGTLCGQCADGYSVAINSPYMSCVPCNSSTVYKGWALLIALEFYSNNSYGSYNSCIECQPQSRVIEWLHIPLSNDHDSFSFSRYPSWLVSSI